MKSVFFSIAIVVSILISPVTVQADPKPGYFYITGVMSGSEFLRLKLNRPMNLTGCQGQKWVVLRPYDNADLANALALSAHFSKTEVWLFAQCFVPADPNQSFIIAKIIASVKPD